MIIETIVNGYLEENCYLAGSPDALLCIDPGDEPERILRRIDEGGYTLSYIVLTHCHCDHIGAARAVREATGARLVLPAKEKDNYFDPNVNLTREFGAAEELAQPDLTVAEGDEIISGDCRFSVIETPGHTSGGICLLCGKDLFSGDTLFLRGMGRVDLPTGSMKQIVASIKNKLFALPDDVTVYPGHGGRTTVGFEKEHNEVYEWERFADE